MYINQGWSTVVFENVEWVGNQAVGGYGGEVFMGTGTYDIEIHRSILSSNNALEGGAIAAAS